MLADRSHLQGRSPQSVSGCPIGSAVSHMARRLVAGDRAHARPPHKFTGLNRRSGTWIERVSFSGQSETLRSGRIHWMEVRRSSPVVIRPSREQQVVPPMGPDVTKIKSFLTDLPGTGAHATDIQWLLDLPSRRLWLSPDLRQ
jgi:hypothetical protein